MVNYRRLARRSGSPDELPDIKVEDTEEMDMELTGKPRRKPDFRLELLDNEMLLYHPAETKILHFNQTASLIWQLCDGERTAAEMISLLSESYPESAGEVTADVQSTLQQFAEQGCIELV